MLANQTVISFFAASLLLAVAPGPDNIFVLAQSVIYGRTAGLWITLGLCSGLLVHTTAVAFGVAAIIQASPTTFTVLKYAGAAYLLYLAWQAFHAAKTSDSSQHLNRPSPSMLYRRGIIMNVTNPKVSIFFLAFLPQFADPARGSVFVQMFMLGGIFMLAALLVFGCVACLAERVNQWLRRSAFMERRLNRFAGVVFIGIAIKLALTQR